MEPDCSFGASYTSLQSCYVRQCSDTLYVSGDINFNYDVSIQGNFDDFFFLPVENCTFVANSNIYTFNRFDGLAQLTPKYRGLRLIEFDEDFLYLANADLTTFEKHLKANKTKVASASLNGARLTYGSWNAICTFDAG